MSLTATYVRSFGAADLGEPWGITVDQGTGNVWVINGEYNHRGIWKYTASGSPVTSASLSNDTYPTGIALAASGTSLWVSQYFGVGETYPRLLKVSLTGTIQESLFSAASPAPPVEGATDVAVGPGGKVHLVSNYYSSVGPVYKQKAVRLDTGNALEQTFGTNETLSGGNFPATQTNGKFAYPVGVAVDSSGNVYVSDVYSQYKSISKFDSSGTFVAKWGGAGTGSGKFVNSAYAITGWHEDGMKLAIDADGHLFATDRYGGKVNVYDLSGNFLLSFSGGGMAYPVAVACGPGGNVYVTDYNGGVTQWTVTDPSVVTQARGITLEACGEASC